MNVDFKSLELIYRNAETQEELDAALEYNNIPKHQFLQIVKERGWKSSPVAVANVASQVESFVIPADSNHIEGSNKASIRRLHSLLEFCVTKFQHEINTHTVAASVDFLDKFVKIREKLTKLEMPLYGLSTADPVVPTNPINIYLNNEEEPTA